MDRGGDPQRPDRAGSVFASVVFCRRWLIFPRGFIKKAAKGAANWPPLLLLTPVILAQWILGCLLGLRIQLLALGWTYQDIIAVDSNLKGA